MPSRPKIGYINLTTGDIRVTSISLEDERKGIDGGVADASVSLEQSNQNADPLGPDNVLLIGGEVSACNQATLTARTYIKATSPLTGMSASTWMGGAFASELAWAGFHCLVVFGRAEKPVYLFVHNGRIEIRDASTLWGKTTTETLWAVRENHDDDEIKCLVIGPAGENLVRYASIMAGIISTGGHAGMGCVMGSKNLKAIAARGTLDCKVTLWMDILGGKEGFVDQVTSVSGHADSGFAPKGKYSNDSTNPSAMTVLTTNHLVDQYGVDNLEIGSVISRAMELYELGILTKEQTEGLDLSFGNDNAFLEMIHRICMRKGWLGDTLADGGISPTAA